MKCQILFSVKNKKKYFKMLSAEIFTYNALCYSINTSWQYDLWELDTLGKLSAIFTWDTTAVTSFCSPEHPIPFKKKGPTIKGNILFPNSMQ